ncbi:MAG: DUF4974 domain-containing protein [Tannerella sp.]|nr:DUF4974 domain-containing protein [Tannerella sp.]
MKIETQHIFDYLENNLPTEEKRAFEQNLKESPELQKELEEIRFIWQTSSELMQHKRVNTERNWDKLSRRISFNRYKNKTLRYTRNAAAILLIPFLIISYVLFHQVKKQGNIETEQVELTSAHGLVSKIILPDGSDVWLNSGSTIIYPQYFTENKRQVFLSGEAYFKVKADKSKRFEVITEAGLMVSAFGTEFNVFAYKEEQTIEATLVSGNIEVTADNSSEPQVLIPGQQVIFEKENKNLDVTDVNLAVKTAWKDGKMIFRRAGMKEIIQRLSRRFNVNIYLENKELYDYTYSATFTTESLHEILNLLEKSAPLKCKIIEPEQSEDYSYSRRTVIISMK